MLSAACPPPALPQPASLSPIRYSAACRSRRRPRRAAVARRRDPGAALGSVGHARTHIARGGGVGWGGGGMPV